MNQASKGGRKELSPQKTNRHSRDLYRLTVDGEVVVDTFAQPHGPKVVPFAFQVCHHLSACNLLFLVVHILTAIFIRSQEGKNYTVVLEFVRDQGCTSLSLVWSLVGGTAAGQALAIKAATAADVIIAVVGEDTSTCGEVKSTRPFVHKLCADRSAWELLWR